MELCIDASLTANPTGLAVWKYKGAHIISATLVATDSTGLDTCSAMTSACVRPDGDTLAAPSLMYLRLDEVVGKSFFTIVVSHQAQPLGQGYQQLGTSVFRLSASNFRSISSDGDLVLTSPWSAPDVNHTVGFSYSYPPIVVGEGTIVISRVARDGDDWPSDCHLELADKIKQSEPALKGAIWDRMLRDELAPGKPGCFRDQERFKLVEVVGLPPGLHADWVARPRHCSVHPRGLESLLEIACMMERIPPSSFIRMCTEDPHSAMGIVSLAAQVVPNSIQYQSDTDLKGVVSDLCMDPRWMLASMRCAEEGSDMARADCEDLANIGRQFVVAFQTSTPDADTPMLTAAKAVASSYTAVFVYCTVTTKRTNSDEAIRLARQSAESATWWPETTREIAEREQWDTTSIAHVTCVCFRDDVLEGMISRAESGEAGHIPAPHGHLIEGTGMLHSRGQHGGVDREVECFKSMAVMRGDIDPETTDFTPMVNQRTQGFYRLGLQVFHNGQSYMFEDPVSGVRGMPMDRILRHPEQVALVSCGPPITDPDELGYAYRTMAYTYPDIDIGNGMPCPGPPPGLVVMGIVRGHISREEEVNASVNGVHVLTLHPLEGLDVRLACGVSGQSRRTRG